MDKEKRKMLLNQYNERTIIGGVYCIKCSGNHRTWIRSTTDLEAVKNRVMFSLNMKGAPEPSMLNECREYGAESFSFEVLEKLEKKKDQTDQEFKDDIAVLLNIWIDKLESK